jgi:hypothetical protein
MPISSIRTPNQRRPTRQAGLSIVVSGVTAQQDGQIAKAGADALPKILGG